MSEDPLRNLLAKADRAATTPVGPDAGLAARVRHQAGRRGRRRAAAAVVGVVTVGLVTGRLTVQSPPAVRVVSVGGVPQTKDLAALRREIEANEGAVRVLLAEERAARAERRLATVRTELSAARDADAEAAAASMLWSGDRLARGSPGLRDEAVRAYAEVERHFPGTASAAIARKRLEQFAKETGT